MPPDFIALRAFAKAWCIEKPPLSTADNANATTADIAIPIPAATIFGRAAITFSSFCFIDIYL
jgi:hypothetical protein